MGRARRAASTSWPLEAIIAAVADAGLALDDVDGLASLRRRPQHAVFVAADLGLPELRYASMSWLPGGGGARRGGQRRRWPWRPARPRRWSCTAACARASSAGSGRVRAGGRVGAAGAVRPPGLRRVKGLLDTHAAFTMPFGMVSPPITYAMVMPDTCTGSGPPPTTWATWPSASGTTPLTTRGRCCAPP